MKMAWLFQTLLLLLLGNYEFFENMYTQYWGTALLFEEIW